MNDELQKLKNHAKLSDFREHWKKRVSLDGGVPCRVRVNYRGMKRHVDTNVHFRPDGKVYIEDSDWFNSLDHYAELNPGFQRYTIGKRRRGLRIRGGSLDPPENKMGGPYLYDIRPVKKRKIGAT